VTNFTSQQVFELLEPRRELHLSVFLNSDLLLLKRICFNTVAQMSDSLIIKTHCEILTLHFFSLKFCCSEKSC